MDNRNQPPRNQRISLRPEITFKAHIAYTRTKTLSKPGVVSMVKGRATRDASSDESCNEMRKQRGKGRQNKISKLWSCPRAMKESIEVRSLKTRSWKPRRARTIEGKPTTRKPTSKTTKIWPNQRRCSSYHQPKSKEEEEQPILTRKAYNVVRNNHTTWNS